MVGEKRECDVEDILCQIEALRSLRGLRTALGNETFQRDFPELENLDGKLVQKIQTTEGSIKEALAKCGNISLEEVTTEEVTEIAEPIEVTED